MKKTAQNTHPGKRSTLSTAILAAGTLAAGFTALPAAAQPGGGALEEIVVTAQRRVEDIQDVPISITALGTEALESRNVENLHDLNMLVPNVAIRGGGTTGPSDGTFVIRGVPGVARYMDGVAQSSGDGALSNVVELERIEVLKGPQGTLFGKNAMGGAIHYVTQGPAEDFGARIGITAGNFRQRQVSVNVDVPLSDTLLTKVTAYSLEKEGYVQSASPNIKFGDENDQVLRLVALWQPTPYFEAEFAYNDIDRHPRYAQADVLFGVVEDQFFVQQYNAMGLNFTDEAHAFGRQGVQEYYSTSDYQGPGWRHDSENAHLRLNWNITDNLTLRSITGGRDIEDFNFADLDGSFFNFFEINGYGIDEERSQEFQLQGAYDRLDWVIGAYWSDTESIGRRYDWQFTAVAPRGTNRVTTSERTDQAIFAEATYQITDRLSATIGGRWTDEDFTGARYDAARPLPEPHQQDFDFTPGALLNKQSASFEAFTPRISAQYNWTDDIMTYATYSEGFNGGGVNSQEFMGEFIAYDGERLNQIELGFRSDLLNNRLRFNMAYFFGIWDDIQVGAAIVPGRIITQNAAEAEVEGFEVDTAWAVNENFQFNFAAGWLSTEYTDVGSAPTIFPGAEFELAPSFTATLGAQYEWFLPGGDSLRLRGDLGHTDDFVTQQDTRLQANQQSYNTLGARLIYDPAGADWSAALWGRNLTDEWYQIGGFGAFLGGVDQGVIARPREWGVTLNMEF